MSHQSRLKLIKSIDRLMTKCDKIQDRLCTPECRSFLLSRCSRSTASHPGPCLGRFLFFPHRRVVFPTSLRQLLPIKYAGSSLKLQETKGKGAHMCSPIKNGVWHARSFFSLFCVPFVRIFHMEGIRRTSCIVSLFSFLTSPVGI